MKVNADKSFTHKSRLKLVPFSKDKEQKIITSKIKRQVLGLKRAHFIIRITTSSKIQAFKRTV